MGIETGFEAWDNDFHEDGTVWVSREPNARARGPRMAEVRDYIGSGARAVSCEASFANIAIVSFTCLALFNAIQTLEQPGGTPASSIMATQIFLFGPTANQNPGHNRLFHE